MSFDYGKPTRGDRTTLSIGDRDILENRVLPIARKWLDIPGLDAHAKQTLAYWGEYEERKAGA